MQQLMIDLTSDKKDSRFRLKPVYDEQTIINFQDDEDVDFTADEY